MIYAGIGSRKAPKPILDYMRLLGQRFAQDGYLLVSGGASGSDAAFERGCREANGLIEVWRPEHVTRESMTFAASIHPAWSKCAPYAKRLHARNGLIILGPELKRPVNFIVCWTPDGAAVGGTAQALRIAELRGIPEFNLWYPDAAQRMYAWLYARSRRQ